jgi:hypothetical protein
MKCCPAPGDRALYLQFAQGEFSYFRAELLEIPEWREAHMPPPTPPSESRAVHGELSIKVTWV